MTPPNQSRTPRVDALSVIVQNQNWGFRDMQNLARQLETELAEANEELEVYRFSEKCTTCNRLWSPSLIESSTCIFCILTSVKNERDALRQQLADLQIVLGCLDYKAHKQRFPDADPWTYFFKK